MTVSLQQYTYYLFANEQPCPHRAIVVNGFITSLIIINVLSVILQSVPAYNEQYLVWFRMVELISAQIFTAEWILRVWACVERPEFRWRLGTSSKTVLFFFATSPYRFCCHRTALSFHF